MQREYILGLWE